MRQLKTFMRNRKKEMLACGPCECRTLQCWRYANENCGCGESKSSLPNYVRVEGGNWIRFFNEDEDQYNDITIEVDTDTETPSLRVVVWEFGIIEDEDAKALWLGMRESLDGEAVMKLFGISMEEGTTWVWHFTPEAMAQFNALINNPTEEQAQILKDWLEDKASNEQLIVVFNE